LHDGKLTRHVPGLPHDLQAPPLVDLVLGSTCFLPLKRDSFSCLTVQTRMQTKKSARERSDMRDLCLRTRDRGR